MVFTMLQPRPAAMRAAQLCRGHPEGLAAAARTRDTRDTRGGGGGDGKTHGKPWENPWGIFQENHGKTGMTGDD